jgi:hypothetical protein
MYDTSLTLKEGLQQIGTERSSFERVISGGSDVMKYLKKANAFRHALQSRNSVAFLFRNSTLAEWIAQQHGQACTDRILQWQNAISMKLARVVFLYPYGTSVSHDFAELEALTVIEEAIMNAIEYGARYERDVIVRAQEGAHGFLCSIEDPGDGVLPEKVAAMDFSWREPNRGRGCTMMLSCPKCRVGFEYLEEGFRTVIARTIADVRKMFDGKVENVDRTDSSSSPFKKIDSAALLGDPAFAEAYFRAQASYVRRPSANENASKWRKEKVEGIIVHTTRKSQKLLRTPSFDACVIDDLASVLEGQGNAMPRAELVIFGHLLQESRAGSGVVSLESIVNSTKYRPTTVHSAISNLRHRRLTNTSWSIISFDDGFSVVRVQCDEPDTHSLEANMTQEQIELLREYAYLLDD